MKRCAFWNPIVSALTLIVGLMYMGSINVNRIMLLTKDTNTSGGKTQITFTTQLRYV